MLLREWLTLEKMTDAEFARVSGVGFRQLVHKYANGSQFPSPANLLRIRDATKGQVTADDFLNHYKVSADQAAASARTAEAAA